jgi:pimeloyl-ACP methyl ester carboxylesterase
VPLGFGQTKQRVTRQSALAQLLWWLGPWQRGTPSGVQRETRILRAGVASGRRADEAGRHSGERELVTHLYRPVGTPLGAYLVTPGLHFDGPDDPRLDRFCRILARAGFVVAAPRLPGYLDLRVEPSVADDLELVGRALAGWLPKPEKFTLFSISFGSWPALELAARAPELVDAVVLFGGFASLGAAFRYCVRGELELPSGTLQGPRDPLNSAALFLNILPFLDEPGADSPALSAALRQLCYRTWGKMELKALGRLLPHAHAVAETLPPELRQLFLVCAGVQSGTREFAERGLSAATAALGFAEPDAAIAALTRPVVICHGRDDDVIPYTEAQRLSDKLSARVPVRVLLTGLFGHTATERVGPQALAREANTLLEIARVLAAGGAVRHTF